jgi:hypothetical protein
MGNSIRLSNVLGYVDPHHNPFALRACCPHGQVVRELRLLLHALVDHSLKLQQGEAILSSKVVVISLHLPSVTLW